MGDVQSALETERDVENRVDALRIKSERAAHVESLMGGEAPPASSEPADR